MNGFNKVANAQAFVGVPTAREVANEYSATAASLKEAGQKLKNEIDNIQTAKSGIAEEFTATIKTFVETTLTDLNGEQFDALALIAQNTPDLGGQGLAFIRNKMIAARDEALALINKETSTTVDAATFQTVLADAKSTAETLGQKRRDAAIAVTTAQGALDALKETAEYEFLKLSEQIRAKGQPALTPENRAYYEPKNAFVALKDYWFSKPKEYGQVIDLLDEYGHGKDGKDLFAEVAGTANKLSVLEADVDSKQKAASELEPSYTAAVETQRKLQELGKGIKTDEEILKAVQGRVVESFATPSFAKAVADHYGEDFPSALPLLSDKMAMMDKLTEGAEGKLKAIQTSQKEATDAAAKFARWKADKAVEHLGGGKFEAMRRRNTARRAQYDNYIDATNRGWHRAHDYQPTTVYVQDNSNALLNYMILDSILDSGHHHDHGSYGPSSAYTADLLGVNKENAADLGVSNDVFNVPDEVREQMKEAGLPADATPFDFGNGGDSTRNSDDPSLNLNS